MEHFGIHTTLIGTMTGTALTLAVNIGSADLLRTAVLGGVGAVSSFVVSVFLRWLFRKRSRK